MVCYGRTCLARHDRKHRLAWKKRIIVLLLELDIRSKSPNSPHLLGHSDLSELTRVKSWSVFLDVVPAGRI